MKSTYMREQFLGHFNQFLRCDGGRMSPVIDNNCEVRLYHIFYAKRLFGSHLFCNDDILKRSFNDVIGAFFADFF